jgi:gluconate kinase
MWINGGFGAGKTTLAEELHRRLPDAIVYDPEDVGLMLWKWMRPNGDFQHPPSWRELVVATALSLRRHHAETLIVPMSLIRDAYRAEILGGLADAGEEVLHVFLETDAGVLRERLNARATHPGMKWDQAARESGMTGVGEMVAAAARQPGGTLMLRLDRLTPAELAGEVLARPDLRQVHADGKRTRQQGRCTHEKLRVSRIKRSQCGRTSNGARRWLTQHREAADADPIVRQDDDRASLQVVRDRR